MRVNFVTFLPLSFMKMMREAPEASKLPIGQLKRLLDDVQTGRVQVVIVHGFDP